MPLKEIKVFGKKITYTNISDASKKLKLPGNTTKERNDNARSALKQIKNEKVIYDEKTGKVDLIDFKLKNSPLLIREFTGLSRVTKKYTNALLTTDAVHINHSDNKILIAPKGLQFVDDVDILNVRYTVDILLGLSDDWETRTVKKGTYTGTLNKNYYNELRYLTLEPSNTRDGSINKITYNRKPPFAKIKNPTTFKKYIDSSVIINQDNMSPFLKNVVKRIIEDYKFATNICITDIHLTTFHKNLKFSLEKMRLFLSVSSNISTNLYNETIEIKETDDNCVVSYLKQKYKSTKINIENYFLSIVPEYKTIGINTDEIKLFCMKYNIKMIAYDIAGNCIATHEPPRDAKGKKAALIYIAYNSHIYPVQNKILNKVMTKTFKEHRASEEEINKIFNDLLKKKIIPSNIHTHEIGEDNRINVSSFVHEDTLYYTNDDYILCHKILSLFNIGDQMTPYINKFNIINKIEQLYNIKNTKSFFPQLKTHSGLRCNYTTSDKNMLKKTEYFKTIDKCKMYPFALHELDFLQSIDIRQSEPIKYDKTHIINKHYLYLCTPKKFSYLMPDAGYFAGDELIYINSKGIEYTIEEYYIMNIQENTFKDMISDYYKKTALINNKQTCDDLKRIMNIYIGKFDNGCDEVRTMDKVDKLCDHQEAELSAGNIYDYNNDYKFVMTTKQKYNIYTRLPIKYQLLNRSRRILYEQMEKMNLTDSQIININVDSITFVPDETTIFNNDDYDASNFKKWKVEKTKEYNINDDNNKFYLYEIDNTNESVFDTYLYKGYAGSGKTYKIINKLIPKLDDSYIVLSPSHSSIEDYRLHNKNCQVIQYYDYNNEIPQEDIIIVDEIGLCNTSANNTIYKCMLSGKKIYCYGDYNQLDPVNDRPCDTQRYLNYAYKHKYMMKTNARNNFTNDYYDNLINGTIDLKQELNKYNTKLYDAEFIICLTNAQCKIYNDKIMKHKKIDIYTIGCLMMCKTNDFRKMDLYNNYIVEVEQVDEEYIYLKDKIKTYKIPLTKYKKFFRPAYARTLYNCQGKSLNSFHIPEDDLIKISKNNKATYTAISRLKQEIIKKDEPIKKIVNKDIDIFDELLNTSF